VILPDPAKRRNDPDFPQGLPISWPHITKAILDEGG
jgi:hypothetical protein